MKPTFFEKSRIYLFTISAIFILIFLGTSTILFDGFRPEETVPAIIHCSTLSDKNIDLYTLNYTLNRRSQKGSDMVLQLSVDNLHPGLFEYKDSLKIESRFGYDTSGFKISIHSRNQQNGVVLSKLRNGYTLPPVIVTPRTIGSKIFTVQSHLIRAKGDTVIRPIINDFENDKIKFPTSEVPYVFKVDSFYPLSFLEILHKLSAIFGIAPLLLLLVGKLWDQYFLLKNRKMNPSNNLDTLDVASLLNREFTLRIIKDPKPPAKPRNQSKEIILKLVHDTESKPQLK